MSIVDIGEEAARSASRDTADGSTGDGSGVDYERMDVTDMSFAKVHPGPTAVAGTVTGLRLLPPGEQFDDDARADVGIVIEDPYIPADDGLEDVAIFESTTDTGDDFKVINTEDSEVSVYDAGVSVGSMFEADQVDTFGVDTIIAKFSTGAARSIARTLDVRGLPNADVERDDSGTPILQDNGYPSSNGGLVEKFPGNDDDTYVQPRYARDPQLRPDVAGEEVTLLVQHAANVLPDYDGNAHWATVLADLDDDRISELSETYANDPYQDGDEAEAFINDVDGVEMLELAPTMEFEPDQALQIDTEYLEWAWPDDDTLERLRDEQGVTVSA